MPFILSTPTLALRFRQKTTALRLLGTTSPRVRSPWLAAKVCTFKADHDLNFMKTGKEEGIISKIT